MTSPLRLSVLVSGNGSNLQTLIDASQQHQQFIINTVISNHANVKALQRAADAGIAHHCIPHIQYDSREAFEAELLKTLQHYPADLIVLAGFMRRLSASFIDACPQRLINIHPSLLPKYRGLHAIEQALASGDITTGSTLHWVTPDLDSGPIICFGEVAIETNDNATSLKTRVQTLEHNMLPWAILKFAQGEFHWQGSKLHYQATPVPSNGIAYSNLMEKQEPSKNTTINGLDGSN